MLYVIGPIFKEEFKEIKTIALRRRREKLQGNPRRDHDQQGVSRQRLFQKVAETFPSPPRPLPSQKSFYALNKGPSP